MSFGAVSRVAHGDIWPVLIGCGTEHEFVCGGHAAIDRTDASKTARPGDSVITPIPLWTADLVSDGLGARFPS